MLESVVVRVPATTANLGPAFDVMGLAMDLWMEVRVEWAATFSMSVEGEGRAEVATDEHNVIVQGIKRAFRHIGSKDRPVCVKVRSDIPFGAGCGSSSAAVVAGLLAGFALLGARVPTVAAETVLQLAAEVEGHPDNAAPAVYGGLQMCLAEGGRYRTRHVPLPVDLVLVLFLADKKMKENTHATRGLIPKNVAMADAVHNMSRTSLLALAFATGRLEYLRDCLGDRFHQPARSTIFPHMQPCIDAAMAAGASYAFLSGAGPTICAIVGGRRGEITLQPQDETAFNQVAVAMLGAAAQANVAGTIKVTRPSEIGMHIVEETPKLAGEPTKIRIHRPFRSSL